MGVSNTTTLISPFRGAWSSSALAQRTTFVTWKDGSAILWDAGYAEEFET